MGHMDDEQRNDLRIPRSLEWLAASEDGAAWLAQLPERLREVCRRWSLTPGQPFEGGACSLAVPVTGRDALDAVLKLQFPGRESKHEADALHVWAGRGAVRLLAHDEARHALLLERCRPGTPLSDAPSSEALAVLAKLVEQLSIPVDGPFTPLAEEAARWARNLPATWERAGRPFERALVDRALALLTELSSTQGPAVLLHQDLHGDNLLRAQRQDWLVIDPKPLVGEKAFALAPIVRSSELGHSRAAVVHRLDHLSEALRVDRERARGWTIAQTTACAPPRTCPRLYAQADRRTDGGSSGKSTTSRIPTMKVTEKGQVTIPKELRDELGIGVGTEVEFERSDDGIVVRKRNRSPTRGRQLAERLRGRGDVAMTTDEIMALTRGA